MCETLCVHLSLWHLQRCYFTIIYQVANYVQSIMTGSLHTLCHFVSITILHYNNLCPVFVLQKLKLEYPRWLPPSHA